MKNKVASLTVALNEEDLIGGCLDLLKVDYKLVIIPNKYFNGQTVTEFDRTEEIAVEHGAVVIHTDIDKEYAVRNMGLEHLHKLGYKYAMIVDADEYWPSDVQDRLFEELEDSGEYAYRGWMYFLFKKPNWKIEGSNNNKAIVVVRTDKRFDGRRPRSFGGNIKSLNIGNIYHFAYVRKPEKIKEKIESFSHHSEIQDGWFENVYMKFDPSFTDFHPVNKVEYPRCVEIELPEEIKSKIPQHLW